MVRNSAWQDPEVRAVLDSGIIETQAHAAEKARQVDELLKADDEYEK
jgi:hypothetical protein